MKIKIVTGIGAISGFVTTLLGGWDAALATLLLLMLMDWVTGGILLPAVFKKSPKSKNGALESRAGWKGLCRKGTILLFVLIGARLDLVFGFNYIRDGICIAFMANELISITENAALMGVPLPKVLTTAIDTLKSKSESYDTKNDDNKEE